MRYFSPSQQNKTNVIFVCIEHLNQDPDLKAVSLQIKEGAQVRHFYICQS